VVSQRSLIAWLKGLASGEQRRRAGSGSALEVGSRNALYKQIYVYFTSYFTFTLARPPNSIRPTRRGHDPNRHTYDGRKEREYGPAGFGQGGFGQTANFSDDTPVPLQLIDRLAHSLFCLNDGPAKLLRESQHLESVT